MSGVGALSVAGDTNVEVLTAWGTVAGAAVTALAVIVALWQAWAARRQADEAHKLALAALELTRAERADAEAHQARQVTSRVSNGSPVSSVQVKNTSSEPIGAVRVEAVYLDNVVAPSEWSYALAPGASTAMLDAGATLTVFVEFRDLSGELLQRPETRGAAADVSFVDSRGVRWRRWGLVQPRLTDVAVHREPVFIPPTHSYRGPGSKSGEGRGTPTILKLESPRDED